MSTWLTSLTAPCCNQLEEMGHTLNAMKDRYVYWNDDYYQNAERLVSQQQYQGPGATAFLQAVDTDINVLRPISDSIGHAGSACANLHSTMAERSASCDMALSALTPPPAPYAVYWELPISVFDAWRAHLIERTLADTGGGGNETATLDSVLVNGNISMYLGAYQAVEEQVRADAEAELQRCMLNDPSLQTPSSLLGPDMSHNLHLAQHAVQQAIEQMRQDILTHYLATFQDLADSAEQALMAWGEALCSAHDTFQNALQQAESYVTARDLFDFIQNDQGVYSSQSTTKPITITPYRTKDGKTGLLISLGGTDSGDWAWDTDIFTALQTGIGSNNVYLDDVRQAMVNYMQEHPEMAGSEITFAGYSLGGMTAQQAAEKVIDNRYQNLRDYNLHVAQVITYGAPVMGTRLNTMYNMYDGTYDPVPLLSSHENFTESVPAILMGGTIDIAAMIISGSVANVLPWNERLHHYIDPNGEYGDQIHNISDVGSTNWGTIWQNFDNHMHYQESNQLNSPTTATTGIDPATFGPTEYFSMKNTDNIYATLNQSSPNIVLPKGSHGALGK